MTSKKQGLLKQRMKDLRKYRIDKLAKNVPIELTIDDKISELKSKILACKYDLEHSFPGHGIIIAKIENYTEQIKKLEAEKKLHEDMKEIVLEKDPKKQLDKTFDLCEKLNVKEDKEETKNEAG